MAALAPFELSVYVLGTLVASFITGVTGFAFGLVAAAIWLYALSPTESTFLIGAYALLVQGFAVWKLRGALSAPAHAVSRWHCRRRSRRRALAPVRDRCAAPLYHWCAADCFCFVQPYSSCDARHPTGHFGTGLPCECAERRSRCVHRSRWSRRECLVQRAELDSR